MYTDVQIIRENNIPAFAVIPYAQYEEMRRRLAVAEKDSNVSFPLEVAEMNSLKGYSLIKAWRIYKGKTQKEIAEMLGVTQGAFSQIEKSEHPQAETLRKLAVIFDVEVAQLTLAD